MNNETVQYVSERASSVNLSMLFSAIIIMIVALIFIVGFFREERSMTDRDREAIVSMALDRYEKSVRDRHSRRRNSRRRSASRSVHNKVV